MPSERIMKPTDAPTPAATPDQEIAGLLATRNQMWADRYVATRHEMLRLRRVIRELRAVHGDMADLLRSGEENNYGV